MITGALTTIDGVECYRIDGIEHMEPFLTTVVSDSDLWMFLSSTGALTAGRVDADRALFPYLTDDQIHRAAGQIGPVTVIARTIDGARVLWRPFHPDLTPGCSRSIAKSVVGDRLILEESHRDWQLRFRVTWAPSSRYGWVRSAEIVDDGDRGADLEVLDGLLDVMPAGVDALTEQIRSNLVDAYKRSETGPWGRLAIFNLESLITDRAEPGEALTATTVWSWGLDGAEIHLDARAVGAMAEGRVDAPERLNTGRPGAYLLRGPVAVPPGGAARWAMIADTGLGHAEVLDTARLAVDPEAGKLVGDDIEASTSGLRDLLAGADGFQSTADPVADAHHLSNVLFNSMRGGVFVDGHRVPSADLAAFVTSRNRVVAERQQRWLNGLDESVDVTELRDAALDTGDADLVRLVLEYLPLTFSRRHGDPSRPWNRFAIRVRDEHGRQLLSYEGNWRDIFQNWEALLASFPAYFVNVVAKFVNASTIDGYNPYRISRAGVDWEVPDPHDPWANIGYWGDHQIVYLLRLLEAWEEHEPGVIDRWLGRSSFVYADVPYTIADHDAMVHDPRNSITFDDERAAEVAARERVIGADGRLVVDASGDLLRVDLVEKLLVPALGKLSNFVPGGGIWMNTQRPEWNDANNALAGPGLSMVTLYHLRRYLRFVDSQLDGRGELVLTATVATWLADLARAFEELPAGPVDDIRRRDAIGALGAAGDAHRRRVSDRSGLSPVEVPVDDVRRLLGRALDHVDVSIEAGRRDDGLFHSYNLLSFPTDDTARVDHLGPMLEGQVAVLSSGALEPGEGLALVEALFRSEMYRADLDTFLLYPPVELPSFLDRNAVPVDETRVPSELSGRWSQIFSVSDDGLVRFRPEAVNAEALDGLLHSIDPTPDERAAIHDLYERVFRHASFTGRSGSMYGYEGIGSVYWHMVAKLLLAVQENYWTAVDGGSDSATIERLADIYRRLRSGLGFRKDPATFGAFPTDCYSHTPAHSGAQQPGMTGQVKEEVLTRLGELGLRVEAGRVRLHPGLLPDDELYPSDRPVEFSFCGVPMTIERGAADGVEVVSADAEREAGDGLALTSEQSRSIMARDGSVRLVRWTTAG